MTAGAAEVERYIADAPATFQPALRAIRAAIAAELTARGVSFVERLSYAMPGFEVQPAGKMVCGYAAFTKKCGFYPHSGQILPRMADLIGTRSHTKSALHFTPDDPIPAALLAAAIDLRLAEIAGTSPP